ncbi:MAG TPA: M20/M25/M40 family metallo-hydrolase [Candidatus Acidoferrales bacterium]|jgi:acetylornithine deacetylase|nr:M20/M25/M40 family metallo-hydrolase [Candidatus Acidoferrales bacterium]
MNVFELTRALVDIESITDNEGAVGAFLADHLAKIAQSTGGQVERMDVEPGRFNVLACWGTPLVTLSTHMDTVPPFFASRDDGNYIWGRGACDAKGIIAAMTAAAETLLRDGATNFGLLFVVGEERNSAGAAVAAQAPRGSRHLVNGEPTDNRLALASKGTLRFELIARGKMAHSAYPELGESAIEKLLDALDAIRRVPLPQDPLLGRSTMNIGTISGGRAPNVIADLAKAEILVRLVGDPALIRERFARAVGARAELKEVLCIAPIRFRAVDGLPTTVVSFTTDVPVFGKTWGEPLLLGPGSIHVAHTENERIAKRELSEAVEMYADVVRRLQA